MSHAVGEVEVKALIACDDIRKEVGSVYSFIGSYEGARLHADLNDPFTVALAMVVRVVRNGPVSMEIGMTGTAIPSPLRLTLNRELKGYGVEEFEFNTIPIGKLSIRLNPDGWQLETSRKLIIGLSQNGGEMQVLRELRIKHTNRLLEAF